MGTRGSKYTSTEWKNTKNGVINIVDFKETVYKVLSHK